MQIISAGSESARQHRADAEEERIAARQHADRRAAPAAMTSSASSIGDGQVKVSAASGAGEREMPRAADDESGLRDRPRAAGERPSSPSSPMPTSESQRPARSWSRAS